MILNDNKNYNLKSYFFANTLPTNDSPQDALEFEYRIGVQIYKLVRFCISDTFGNPLTPNETMWWYNLLIQKNQIPSNEKLNHHQIRKNNALFLEHH